jgi:hypothetical protein
MTDPFDQSLYDQLEAEADNYEPNSENMPTVHRRHIFSAWYAGWDSCAEVAARISAERQPVPVIPEGWELNNISSGIVNGEVDYGAALTNGNRVEFGYGPTWLDALNAAIEAAKESDEPDDRKIYIGFKQKDKENGCE